jgi:FMN hydrolase / 5-amino-6-(5-phospho-D-ribitylamino)uracil phosphatase
VTIKAVFFDLDDTLCDTSGSRQDRALIAARILAEAEPGLDVDDLVARILSPVSDDGWPRGVASVLVELGLQYAPHGVRAHSAWFFEGCEDLIRTYSECAETLALLGERYTLGVITNGGTVAQRRKFEALGLDGHFRPDLFVPSEAAGFHKPDPRIFKHALRLAGVAPAEAVMIGDWLPVDVTAAQEAGMRGVWFNPHGRPLPEGPPPDAVIQCYEELPSILEKLG